MNHWTKETIELLKDLHENKKYDDWSDSIKKGRINKFSDKLESILRRLGSIVVLELECSPKEKEKIIKILEMAAVAGETL